MCVATRLRVHGEIGSKEVHKEIHSWSSVLLVGGLGIPVQACLEFNSGQHNIYAHCRQVKQHIQVSIDGSIQGVQIPGLRLQRQ